MALAQQDMVRRAVARIAPSIVTIETVGGTAPQGPDGTGRPLTPPEPQGDVPRPDRERRHIPMPAAGAAFPVAEGPTTGLVFSADGLILTSSFHFARNPAVITVRLPDGTRHPARLLARDEIRRLAMLKIAATGLPVPAWADEDHVRVGRTAIALGRGLGGDEVSISVGIISGTERMSGNAIQTDAKLSPANYGGPLVDLHGGVLGLIVPMSYTAGDLAGVELYDSGIGFAIPAWQVEPAAATMARGVNIRRGVLGVRITAADARRLRIAAVAEPSPAKAAGLAAGDELLAIDDRPVTTWSEMHRRLVLRAEGEAVALTIRRADRTFYADAVLAAPEAIGPFPAPSEREGRPSPATAPRSR
ncbi:MAG: S1C family serine protease [Phycisphaerae bacterium]